MFSAIPLFSTTSRRGQHSTPTKLIVGAVASIVLGALSLPYIGHIYSSASFESPPPPPCYDCHPGHPHFAPDEVAPTLTTAPPPSPSVFVNSEELTLDDIRILVASTDGFLARDWDLGLGWNNMRYIIETALHQAKLLHRTLVLPSFVYARGCQYEINVCADYVPMVNRGDAVGNDEWRDLPIEQQMGWRIPIGVLLNITRLRDAQPVITTTDYLRLHGLDPLDESTNGYWQRKQYHASQNVFTGQTPSLFTVENHDYEPKRTVRVNELSPQWQARASNTSQFNSTVDAVLREALEEDKVILEWDAVQLALNSTDEAEIRRTLTGAGWEVLHTYAAVVGLDYNKAVVEPILQAAPLTAMHGFKNEYFGRAEDVLFVVGGIHYGRKPGSMLFTSRDAQDAFSNIVLYDMSRIDEALRLADTLVERMYNLTNGHQWMAAHMRRGDFVRYGWAMESTPEKHMSRVKRHLKEGREIVTSLKTQELETFDIPGIRGPDVDIVNREPPIPDGRFFVATDERDPQVLDYFRQEGAVFMDDLLTIDDRRKFGASSGLSWALMITDVRAVIEQVILSKSAFFYGHAMSSLPGGVMNLRAVRGADPRTSLID